MSVFDGTKEDGWAAYLNFGGLPPVVLQTTDEDKMNLLKSLLQETYLTDILNRNKVNNSAELEDLFNILASNIGGLTNPQKLSNTFETVKKISISPATLKRYIEYFDDAFLIEGANRYDVKGRKYIGTPMKYYFSDLGLRNAQLNFRQQELTLLMENAVYNELRYRGYQVDIGVVVVNGKDEKGVSVRRQSEVDFVCNKGSKRCYLQSAYSLPTPEKVTQEIDSLLRLDDSFQKFVITGDRILKYQNENGITFMNIFDFMLNENSLVV
jgi:predicted AAA+ superfamily ATPase